ncbi:MAG: YceI family protein [Endomicrobiales bacterium]
MKRTVTMAYAIEVIRRKAVVMAAALVFLAGAVSLARAAEGPGYEMVLKPGSKIELHGNSTFHPWHSDTAEFIMKAEAGLSPGASVEKDGKQALLDTIVRSPAAYSFVLTVPVRSLKSGTPGLAGKIHGTLKHKQYQNITFTMSGYEAQAVAAQPGSYRITAKGTLEISGQKREITLDLAAETTGGRIKVTGEEELLMTDYGVKPPVFLMIKAADKVLVKWELYLDAAALQEAALKQAEQERTAQGAGAGHLPL